MEIIRKIWVGRSIREDSMSWELGQWVRLGKDPKNKGKVSFIEKTDDGYVVFIEKDNQVMPWKKTNMAVTVEYDITF